MDSSCSVSAGIVTYNSCDKIGDAVLSVTKHTENCTLYISDNGSTDNTLGIVKEYAPDAVILENKENLGFGAAHNKVIPLLNSRYHAVINPDIIFDYDVIGEICEYLDSHPEAVMATPKILNPDGTEQCLPKRMPTLKYLFARRLHLSQKIADEYTRANENLSEPTVIDFCTGCFFVIRTEVFKKLGGFDDRFFMYFEDTDLTQRAKEYGSVIFLPGSHVTHLWEKSSAKSLKYFMIHLKSTFRFFWKYRKKRGTNK
ncbi:MAG: glycosyltransferase family 2 protein [Ruminococcaceae bacterium]|nr:glycosyltransferase family 2 protein [Oscillospiraceae bacterium]